MKPVGIKVVALFLLGILRQVQFLGPVHHTQKHRITGVGRVLLRASSPTSLLKQGQLEQIAQEYTNSIHESQLPQKIVVG